VFVGPVEGELAEGEVGAGRMAEPEQIADAIELVLAGGGASSLSGLRILVSAGGSRERLDAVRFVGNRSSGRMGVAVAEEARRRGAEVTLLASNLAVPAPAGVTVVETPTAADLEREALARADADVIVMAAAVADYRPAAPETAKRPKDGLPWTVELTPTTDVLAALGEARRAGQVLVGFAADGAEPGLERAREKRVAKRADLIVFNDVSRRDIGFDAADNEVVLLSNEDEKHVAKAPKGQIAAAVLDEVERILGRRSTER
jgi:phosphopantothenoylcysteine decarboxylase / phosphopantothenate---cysteine ligase